MSAKINTLGQAGFYHLCKAFEKNRAKIEAARTSKEVAEIIQPECPFTITESNIRAASDATQIVWRRRTSVEENSMVSARVRGRTMARAVLQIADELDIDLAGRATIEMLAELNRHK